MAHSESVSTIQKSKTLTLGPKLGRPQAVSADARLKRTLPLDLRHTFASVTPLKSSLLLLNAAWGVPGF